MGSRCVSTQAQPGTVVATNGLPCTYSWADRENLRRQGKEGEPVCFPYSQLNPTSRTVWLKQGRSVSWASPVPRSAKDSGSGVGGKGHWAGKEKEGILREGIPTCFRNLSEVPSCCFGSLVWKGECDPITEPPLDPPLYNDTISHPWIITTNRFLQSEGTRGNPW